MKLWEAPKGVWLRTIAPEFYGHEVMLDHIDGMYSFCHNREGKVCHPVAWVDVELIEEKKK